MAVTIAEVRHIAELARLGIDDVRATEMTAQLNAILAHMAVLAQLDTAGVEPVTGVGTGGMPLREDHGPALPLARPRASFAPVMRDDLFIVPRLSTHEDAGGETG